MFSKVHVIKFHVIKLSRCCNFLSCHYIFETQTHKNPYERHQNTQGIFEVLKPNDLADKHILLVDDVLTTGSTLEACAHAFHAIPNIKISIFALSMYNG